MGHGQAYWWALARRLGARTLLARNYGSEPVVLMYHRFSEAPTHGRVHVSEFEAQLRFLASHCNVISLQELTRGLIEGVRWPHATVAITIDDGYYDMFDVAFPLLRRYQFPATVFVTTAFIDGGMWYWPDKLRWLVNGAAAMHQLLQVDGTVGVLRIETRADREAAWQRVADHAFAATAGAATDAFIENLAVEAGVSLPKAPPAEFRALSWQQLCEMSGSAIEIAAHGVRHERMTALTDSEVRLELLQSKQTIEAQVQREVRSFAYPFGGVEDQDERVRGAVRDAGYDAGCVSFFDAELYRDRYAMRRFGVGPDRWDFIKTAEGLKRANSQRRARNHRVTR